MTTTVGVAGASGRLGQVAVKAIETLEGFEAKPLDAHGEIDLQGIDLVFDATVLAASIRVVRAASEAGIPAIIATSGWTADRIETLRDEGVTGVRIVPNFSVASVVATHLATIAAEHMHYAEIIEAHHERKRDAPSGTAVRTAERIAEVRAQHPFTPDEPGRGAIINGVPVHALRTPGVSAWQEVRFGGTGETLMIRHDTLSGDSYTAGMQLALRAEPPTGIAVGLDSLLDLTVPSDPAPNEAAPVDPTPKNIAPQDAAQTDPTPNKTAQNNTAQSGS